MVLDTAAILLALALSHAGVFQQASSGGYEALRTQWVECIQAEVAVVSDEASPEEAAAMVLTACDRPFRLYRARFEASIQSDEPVVRQWKREDLDLIDAPALRGLEDEIRGRRAQQRVTRILVGRWRLANSSCDDGMVFRADGTVLAAGRENRWSVAPGGLLTLGENFDMPVEVTSEDQIAFTGRRAPLALTRCPLA